MCQPCQEVVKWYELYGCNFFHWNKYILFHVSKILHFLIVIKSKSKIIRRKNCLNLTFVRKIWKNLKDGSWLHRNQEWEKKTIETCHQSFTELSFSVYQIKRNLSQLRFNSYWIYVKDFFMWMEYYAYILTEFYTVKKLGQAAIRAVLCRHCSTVH